METNKTNVLKFGVTVFKTTPYGHRKYSHDSHTYYQDEVRMTGTGYRVVEVTRRGRIGEEKTFCEYVLPTEYPNRTQAVAVAINSRHEYLATKEEQKQCAAQIVHLQERAYHLGIKEGG